MNVSAFIKVDKAAFQRFIATEPEGRYEFESGRIVQQPGHNLRHSKIANNWLRSLLAWSDRHGDFVSMDRGVETERTIRYPDIVLEPGGADDDSSIISNPRLIVEILSPTSVSRDLDVKPAEYLSLPLLQAYIVASQDEAACMVWVRDGAGAFAETPVLVAGDDKSIDIPSLSLSIPLAEVYAGLFKPGAPPLKD